eukprot:3254174-Lingulodinium_polyedra.AAC.1
MKKGIEPKGESILEDAFATLSSEDVETIKMDGYKVWTCVQAMHQTMFIPTGYLVCESVLNAEPAFGFRLALVMKGTAEGIKEFSEWFNAKDPQNECLKALGVVYQFLSKQ